MASGRFLDARRASSISHVRPRPRREGANRAASDKAVLRQSEQPEESWTRSQQDLALALHVTGRKTLNEIAERLGLRPDTVARMIVSAKRAWPREAVDPPTGPGRLGR